MKRFIMILASLLLLISPCFAMFTLIQEIELPELFRYKIPLDFFLFIVILIPLINPQLFLPNP